MKHEIILNDEFRNWARSIYPIWPKLALFLLTDKEYGVTRFHTHPLITRIIELYQRVIDGERVPKNEWDEAHKKMTELAYETIHHLRRCIYETARAAANYYALDPADDNFDIHFSKERTQDLAIVGALSSACSSTAVHNHWTTMGSFLVNGKRWEREHYDNHIESVARKLLKEAKT